MSVSLVPPLIPTHKIPGLRIYVDRSYAGTATDRPRTLIVAPCETGASLPTGLPALVTSLDDVATYCGEGSPMYEACAAYWTAHPTAELWIAWPGDGTTKATFTGTLSGTTSAAGTLHLYGNGIHHLAVAIPKSSDATATAELLETAVDGADDFPCTLNNTAGALTFETKFGGVPANFVDLRWNYGGATAGESTPAGLTLPTIVAGVAGATDVSHATLIAAIADDRFDHVVLGYNDTTTIGLWATEIARRWGDNVMLYSWASVANKDIIADLKTWVETHDDWRIQAIGYEAENPTPPWIIAADYGATCEYHRTLGPTGSPHQGVDGYTLGTAVATPKGNRFTKAQRELLLGYGCATMSTDSSGDVMVELEEASNGDPIQNTWILKAWNEYKISELTQPAYRNKALISDELDPVPAGCMAPKSLRAKYLAMGRVAFERGWFRDYTSYQAGLVVEPVTGDPDAVAILETPNLAGQLRRINNVVQFTHTAS